MEEIWKDIEGYEGLYQVSNKGRVLSCHKNKILNQRNSYGYCRVNLNKNGIKKSFSVHRLVAQAFIPNPDNFPVINHKDEIKNHNCVDNLEWCDVRYNTCYGSGIKRMMETKAKKGLVKLEHIGLGKKERQKLYYQENKEYRKEYDRQRYLKKKQSSTITNYDRTTTELSLW